jgi:NAD(P)-dependent dehydrogenase (short-subunit alcohol dehydrogenase family)
MTDPSTGPMSGRVCIVTGANAGMGKATARALAGLGATVVMVCRDRDRGDAAAQEIRGRYPNAAVAVVFADFSSLESVRALADELTAAYGRIHVLINNAGVLMDHREESADGYELTFAVNYLAPFVLTHRLLPALQSGAPARIVNVVSGAHRMGKLDFDDLQSTAEFRGFRGAYAQSKLALVVFTYDLARRLDGTGVTVNAADPGGTKTNTKMPGLFALFRPFFQSADKGAETTIWAASAPELATVTGKYFNKMKEKRSAPASYDEETTRRLREVSLELTGMKKELDIDTTS